MPQSSRNHTTANTNLIASPDSAQPGASSPGARPGEGLTASLPPSQELITWDRLTGRERDVLYGIARGQSNREIATSLGIGLGTVKAHVKRLFLKLGVHDRARAPLVAVGELERAAKVRPAKRGQRSQPSRIGLSAMQGRGQPETGLLPTQPAA